MSSIITNLIKTNITTSTKYNKPTLFNSLITISKRSLIHGRFKPFPQRRKPQPNREERATKSKKIVELVRESIERDEPHFSVGSKKLFFPGARICLLRPNAKHTPYQAKFIVPKSFNKLDLRDYLYHIYGLRVLNITVALTPAKFQRSLPMPYRTRHRAPQIKKMTVDLTEPFIWPAETQQFKDELELVEQLKCFREDKEGAVNSDLLKPSKAFGEIFTS
ncbi:unnamed protein product [[Candida] boidinii]|nr:unnamed protein product [[Candida] boidinii]